MIQRKLSQQIITAAEKMPIIAVTGPRQSGKSTLIQQCFPKHKYFNLEDLELRDFALSDPKGFLKNMDSKAIIDEVQYAPDLLSYLQVITDREKIPGQFIISGSQNLLLMDKISQSLAGRVAIFNLLPFSLVKGRNMIQDVPSEMYDLERNRAASGQIDDSTNQRFNIPV
jgi:predicted AAA+ superfamily ATPase